LIQKIYHADPLLYCKYLGSIRIISSIEQEPLAKKILEHLNLWNAKRKSPPRANGPPAEAFINYDESSSPSADDYLIDADYPMKTCPKKKSSRGQRGELCLNLPKSSIPTQKIKVDMKNRFRYQVGMEMAVIRPYQKMLHVP